MKIVFIALASILSIGIIVTSHFAWVERTSISGNVADDVIGKERRDEDPAVIVNDLALAKNWPKETILAYERARENELPYTVVLVGSASSMGNEDGWAAQLSRGLHDHYQATMQVEIVRFNSFSGDFDINEVTRLSPDLVLIEPFLMKDNDWYEDVTAPLAHIDEWREALEEVNGGVTVMLQPANPFYLPQKYQEQVDALQTYANEQELTYLNHWQAWPDTNDASIANFLEGDYYPNTEGHKVWADYLLQYFISE